MNQKNNLIMQQVNSGVLIKSMLAGATIGLFIISLFLISVDSPNPAWGSLWMVKPLIITPSSGAFAGLVFYTLNFWKPKSGWKNVLAFVSSLFICCIIIWLGIVLGLNGTLWD